MSKPVALTKEKHGELKLIEPSNFSRFKEQHLVPVVVQEILTLATEFPIVFVKNSESDNFVVVALMGLNKGQNLYCQTDQWDAQVLPAGFTNAPLSVALLDKAGEKFVVCIDEDSPLVSKTQGEALFNEAGEQTEYMQKRIESVVRIAEQTVQTQHICKLFADKELLFSNQLKIKHREDARQYVIDGVFTIDEKALNELPAEGFEELRKNGLLPVIYSHLTSINQLRRLSRLQYLADTAQPA